MQERWHPDPDEHEAALAAGIGLAAGEGAQLVCLQELTLSRYFAVDPAGPQAAGVEPEELPGGATYRFAARMARETGIHVHASLYERADRATDGLGYNTAIIVAPDGELLARTRKLHIPVTAGYHEDRYFRAGPGDPRRVPADRLRGRASRSADLLGPVVSRGRARIQPRGRRRARVSRPRSAPSPITRSSTPSRCGRR